MRFRRKFHLRLDDVTGSWYSLDRPHDWRHDNDAGHVSRLSLSVQLPRRWYDPICLLEAVPLTRFDFSLYYIRKLSPERPIFST